MGGVLAIPGFLRFFKNPGPYTIGIMISTFNLGCASGCLANIIYGQKLGRRRALFLAFAWLAVSLLLLGSRTQYLYQPC